MTREWVIFGFILYQMDGEYIGSNRQHSAMMNPRLVFKILLISGCLFASLWSPPFHYFHVLSPLKRTPQPSNTLREPPSLFDKSRFDVAIFDRPRADSHSAGLSKSPTGQWGEARVNHAHELRSPLFFSTFVSACVTRCRPSRFLYDDLATPSCSRLVCVCSIVGTLFLL